MEASEEKLVIVLPKCIQPQIGTLCVIKFRGQCRIKLVEGGINHITPLAVERRGPVIEQALAGPTLIVGEQRAGRLSAPDEPFYFVEEFRHITALAMAFEELTVSYPHRGQRGKPLGGGVNIDGAYVI